MGLDDYLLNLPTIMASLKQKINDLRSKDFKGQYEAKKGVVKESKSEKQSILTVQNEDLSNESNFIEEEGLNLDDLLTSSQQKISALSFFELESKEGDKVEEYDVEDDGDEGEDRDEADDNGGEEDNEEFAEE
jgi:hypothetical protein